MPLSTIEQWNQDPEFSQLPYQQKRQVIDNYFDSRLADDEYFSLSYDDQDKIKHNFYEKEVGPVPIERTPLVPTVQEEEKGFFGRIGEKWKTGEAQTELGILRSRQLMGEDTPEIRERIAKVKKDMPQGEEEKRNLFERAIGAAAEMLPIQVEGMKQGAKRGIALGTGFGTIAGIAGQAGPQVATPEEIITVPAAFAGGFGVGMVSGTLENIGKIEAGLAYDELLDLKDENGNKIDPKIAKAAAASVGVVNGLIEMSQIGLLLKTIPGGKAILTGAIRKTITEAVKKGTLKQVALRAGIKYGVFVTAETGQEVLQESTNILMAEVAKKVDRNLGNSNIAPATRQEIISRLVETAEQSALAFMAMGAPGTVVTTGMDVRAARKDARNELLDPGEEGADAREILTGEKPVSPDIEAVDTLDAEEQARQFDEDELDRVQSQETQTKKPKIEKPKAPWIARLTDAQLTQRIENLENNKRVGRLNDTQASVLERLHTETENRGIKSASDSAGVFFKEEIEEEKKENSAKAKEIFEQPTELSGKSAQESAQAILVEEEISKNQTARDEAKKDNNLKYIAKTLKIDNIDNASNEELLRAKMQLKHQGRDDLVRSIDNEFDSRRSAKTEEREKKQAESEKQSPPEIDIKTPKKEEQKYTTLGGAIRNMGGIKTGGLKTDILYQNDAAQKGKLINEKSGLEIEKMQSQLVDAGWMLPSEDLTQILSENPDRLREGMLDGEAKTKWQKERSAEKQAQEDEIPEPTKDEMEADPSLAAAFPELAQQYGIKTSPAEKPEDLDISFDFGANTDSGTTSADMAGVATTDTKDDDGAHEYSSTQVNIPESEAKEIKEFSSQIPDSELADDGREDTPHITVKYGLHTNDLRKAQPLIKGVGPIKAKLGKVSIFENDDEDVVMVEIDSPELHALNKKIADGLEHTDTHPDYKPHATIAYVKKGEGKKYGGDDRFEGKEITLNSLVFSGKDGRETKYNFKKKPKSAKKPTVTSEKGPGKTPTTKTSQSPKGGDNLEVLYQHDTKLFIDDDGKEYRADDASDSLSLLSDKEFVEITGYSKNDFRRMGGAIYFIPKDKPGINSIHHISGEIILSDDLKNNKSTLQKTLIHELTHWGQIQKNEAPEAYYVNPEESISGFMDYFSDPAEVKARFNADGRSDEEYNAFIKDLNWAKSTDSGKIKAPDIGEIRIETRKKWRMPLSYIKQEIKAAQRKNDYRNIAPRKLQNDIDEIEGIVGHETSDALTKKDDLHEQLETIYNRDPISDSDISNINEFYFETKRKWNLRRLGSADRKLRNDEIEYYEIPVMRVEVLGKKNPQTGKRGRINPIITEGILRDKTGIKGIAVGPNEINIDLNASNVKNIYKLNKKTKKFFLPNPTISPEKVSKDATPASKPTVKTKELSPSVVSIQGATQPKPSRKKKEDTLKFGETIGGSKYDKAQERLSLSSITDMNERERHKNIVKRNIWPKPDYVKMVESGHSPENMYLIKKVIDSIPVRPEKVEDQELFIQEVGRIRDIVEQIKPGNDIQGLFGKIFTEEYHSRSGYSKGWTEKGGPVAHMLKPKFLKAVQISNYDMLTAKRKVEKTGFPAKQEAWKQGIEIVERGFGDNATWSIFRRKGGRMVEVLGKGFKTKEEAQNHLTDVLQPKLKASMKGKGRFKKPMLDHITRTGTDYRDGKDITTDDILETFGFRGGEFGKWLNEKNQQESLNHAYDAFMDLANILDIPPMAISLNGTLGIAFGARGSGGAAAHYEGDKVVINLTKLSGAGSLAHEWGHAFDDYFGKMAKSPQSGKYMITPLSAGKTGKESTVRPEMLNAWLNVRGRIAKRDETKKEAIARVEKEIKKSKRYTKSWLDGIRTELERDDTAYSKKKRAATESELKSWDKLTEEILAGKHKPVLDENVRSKYTMPAVNDFYKGVKGVLPASDTRTSLSANINSLQRNVEHLAEIKSDKAKPRQITTNFKGKAKELGNVEYWGNPHELFARALESYVDDQIREQPNKSQYLVHSTQNSLYGEDISPYPMGVERVAINKAFDGLFDVLESKETDRGVALFYKRRNPQKYSVLSKKKLEAAITGISGAWENAPDIVVLQKQNELPEKIQKMADGDIVDGAHYQGKIFLVAENMKDTNYVVEVLLHEAFGHYGIRGVLGKNLAPVLRDVYIAKRKEVQEIAQEYGFDLSEESGRALAADEWLAREAQKNPESKWIDRVISAIRAFVRKFYPKFKMTDKDIRKILADAKSYVTKGKRKSHKSRIPSFSKDKKADKWHSQMANFLNMKLTNGPAKQIKSNLQAWAKKGLIKQEELEWSGLLDWLDSKSKVNTWNAVADKDRFTIELREDGRYYLYDTDLGPDNTAAMPDYEKFEDAIASAEDVVDTRRNKTIKLNFKPNKPGKVKKIDTLNYLKDNNVTLQEVLKDSELWVVWDGEEETYFETHQEALDYGQEIGAPPEDIFYKESKMSDATKFSQYTLPGGKNYKELLLTLPANSKPQTNALNDFIRRMENKYVGTERHWRVAMNDQEADEFESLAEAERLGFSTDSQEYKSSHWQEPNVLAHVRFNERTDADGNKVLFIEEIQSDWASEGRKKGFRGKFRGQGFTKSKAVSDALKRSNMVPNAPFVGSTQKYVMLAVKRMVRHAAENGFDKIAWTTGQIQSDRYDLSKQLESITYAPDSKKGFPGILRAYPLSPNEAPIIKRISDENELAVVIGKGLAEKIIDGDRDIRGKDLKVDSPGMRGFYDKIIPAAVNKFFNKAAWGKAKVETIKIQTEIGSEGFEIPQRVEDVWSLPLTPKMKQKALREGMPLFKKRDRTTKKSDTGSGILPAEVEQRMEASRGVPKTTLKEKVKEQIVEIRRQRQHFPKLKTIEDKNLRHRLADILRRHQEVPESVKQQTIKFLSSFTQDLSKQDYEAFRMHIILADMKRDIDKGLLDEKSKLPFGFSSIDDVEKAFKGYQELANNNPKIKKALKKRNDKVNEIKQKLVDAKLLKKEVMEDEDYFHHQVLMFWDDKYGLATGSSDVRTHWRGWMAARKGSALDYNTEYIEAEFMAISQQMAQLEAVATLKRIKDEADVYSQIKSHAKAANFNNFYKKLKDAFGHDVKDTDDDPLKPFRAKIAMSNMKLAEMAANGKLHYDSEWQEIVDALNNSYSFWKENKDDIPDIPTPGVDDPRWFHFLSHLLNTQAPGANWAATIFKSIKGRDTTIQSTLGGDFLTYRNLIPKGYKQWKPDPGKGWFWANTVADNALQRMIDGELNPKDVEFRKIIAKGRDLIWIIPEGLADTLDKFIDYGDPSHIGKVADKALSMWKQWILLNPFSVVRYNLNNMSGDLDAVLAYAPGIAGKKYAHQAMKDLWKWHRRKNLPANVQKEIDEARKLGVIGSGFSVQEVDDALKILSMDKIVRDVILDEKPNWFNPKTYGEKYWKYVQMFTALRENVLRLAAYRWFLENNNKQLYGASKPEEIDAITDPHEKAAKLARELLGDYGNLSKTGEWVRKRLIPFYSWLEINTPRYVYLMRNSKYENRKAASATGKMAMVGGKKVIMSSASLALRASMLYGAVMLWNMTMFPDEERELGETGRNQLHIILGRREDGSIISIRFQGALSDALSWFGMEDWPYDVKDLIEGKKTILDKLKEAGKGVFNRTIHGLRPEIKMFAEQISGKSYYPDATRGLPIRDRLEHAMKTFKLDQLTGYRAVIGRPGRGKNPDAPRAVQVMQHLVNDLQRILVYYADPGMLAYYDTRGMVFDWLAKEGDEKRYGGRPTSKANSFYWYKQAMKFGDLEAAHRYLTKYYEKGGTERSKITSIRNAHPLSSIPKMRRKAFRDSLKPDQDEVLKRALKWYKKTYLEKEGEK